MNPKETPKKTYEEVPVGRSVRAAGISCWYILCFMKRGTGKYDSFVACVPMKMR